MEEYVQEKNSEVNNGWQEKKPIIIAKKKFAQWSELKEE